MKKYSCFILTLISLIGFSQENPVSIQADTTQIRFGEQIEYKILVNEKENVIFPNLKLDSLGMLEIVESIPIDTLKDRLERRYLLTSFDSGVFLIPRQEIQIDNKKYLTDSLLINVATVKVDTTKQKMFPIKSIKREPKTLEDYKHLWWLLIPIALLIALILYLLLRKKVKKEKVKVYIPPFNEALNRLKALDEKQLLQQNKVKAYYTELTDIVRTYIEKDTKIPALESTTNELIETIIDFNSSSNLGIDPGTIQELKAVLSGADLVKFAKWKPEPEEIKSDRNSIEEILKSTQEAMHKDDENSANEEEMNALFSNVETKVVEIPVKKKSFFRRFRLLLLVLVVALLGTIGYFVVYSGSEDDTIEEILRAEVYEEPWTVSSYGYPPVRIETPELMEMTSVQLPKNAFSVMGDYARFTYGSIGDELYVSVAVTKFFEKLKNLDLDEGIDVALEELAARYETEFSNIKKEKANNNGNKGRKITASFMNDNVKNNMRLLLFADKEGFRQVFISNNLSNKKASYRGDRVLNTLEIK